MLASETRQHYNKISQIYGDANERPYVQHYLNYTLFDTLTPYLEANSNCKALELACGNGYHAKLLKSKYPQLNLEASDISDKQIELANQEEQSIKFYQQDVRDLDFQEEFDLIYANYLLNYALNKQDLIQMLSNIYSALKKGSTFITYFPNPAITPNKMFIGLDAYGYEGSWEPHPSNKSGKVKEGDFSLIEIFDPLNQNKVNLRQVYLLKQTYLDCFDKVGFQCTWKDARVDPKEYEKDPKSWNNLVKREAPFCIVELTK